MLVRSENLKGFGASKGNFKRNLTPKGMDRHSDHCGVDGHTKDTCFKLHSFPDLYKDLKMKNSNLRPRPLLTLQILLLIKSKFL